MQVNRQIQLMLATLAGSLSLSAPAIAADRLFTPDRALVEAVKLAKKQAAAVQELAAARAKRKKLVFPIKAKPDYGDAGAAYGTARGRRHHGQDVFAPAGTPLRAIRNGVVIEAGSDGGAGNHVAIYNRAKDQTYAYFHMVAPTALAVGDRVEAGERLGAVGCTGSCWGDHLHFELRRGRGLWQNESVNPLSLLSKAERQSS